MTSTDFIDQLERELRAAGRRRVRLELARLPRVPAGATVLVLSVALILAVAVPLLATHSRSSEAGNPSPGGGSSVVVGCGQTVSGQLPVDWRSARAGTVVTGPVAWLFLSQDAPHAVITHTELIEALVIVDPGREVRVSVPSSERRQLALDYTDVSPRRHFRLADGASEVTFRPCSGPVGQRQFLGGFILSRAQCAVLDLHVAGSSTSRPHSIPLGRSCGVSAERRLRVLNGDGIGHATFGEGPKSVIRKLDALLGRGPSKSHADGHSLCGINRTVDWPGLEVYFQHHRFVGYSYGRNNNQGVQPDLATARGLRLGDTVEAGRHLYGSAFKVSAAQGGSWLVRTRRGRLDGFLSDVTNPKGRILTIEAGYVGCPALSP